MAAKILFAFCLLLLVCIAESQPDVTKFFNVKNYGAIADGKTDNSAVCNNYFYSFGFNFLEF
jgi:hypothetical protein